MTDSRLSNVIAMISRQLVWLDNEVDRIPRSLLGAPETCLAYICDVFVEKLRLNFQPNGSAGQSLSAELPVFIYQLRQTLPLFDTLVTEPAEVDVSQENNSLLNQDDCVPTN